MAARNLKSLFNAQVLALCDSELSSQEQTQLSDLLGKQRENQLQEDEMQQLNQLLQRYATIQALTPESAMPRSTDEGTGLGFPDWICRSCLN